MEAYDLIMLAVLALATLFGAWKGLAWQIASLASIFASYVVAYNFRAPLGQMIDADPPWNTFLAMLILYLGTSLVIWLAFRFVSDVIDRVRLKEFDRHAGAVMGLSRGVLWCVIITLFAVTLLGDAQKEAIIQSRSGYYIAQLLDRSHAVMPEEVHEVLGPYIHSLDARLEDPVAHPHDHADAGDSPGFWQPDEQGIGIGFPSSTPPSGYGSQPPEDGQQAIRDWLQRLPERR